MNVASLLSRAAGQRPDSVAIRAGSRSLTFQEVEEWTARLAGGFVAEGYTGHRTLLLVKAGIDLIAVTYALFRAGAVPVLIDPGMGRAAFLDCVRRLAPTRFVGIPLGHVARLLNPGTFSSVEKHVTVGTRWMWGGPTLETLAQEPVDPVDVAEDAEAAVLFTSGSTGPAKGVIYTHGMFAAQVEELRRMYGFEPGEIDCAAFPLFSLFDNALEMTSVIPELDPSRPGTCDPAKVADALRGCTTAFGSPAIWTRVAPWAIANGVTFPGVRRVLMAGAPVSPTLIEQVRRVLPDGDVGTPYGATECLPVASITGQEVLSDTAARTAEGAGTCVGHPAPGITVRIVPIHDGPLSVVEDAEGVGEIVVSGGVVTRSYADPAANATAKIVDGDRVWHRIGDLGYLDATGRLWFCGRKSERVGELYTDKVEGTLRPLTERRLALVEGPLIVVEGAPDPELEGKIRARGWNVRWYPSFPVDVRHNAKIKRDELRRRL